MSEFEDPYTSGDVARLFRVSNKTVGEWAKAGKLTFFKTLGGHRRYPRKQVDELLTLSGSGVDVVQSG